MNASTQEERRRNIASFPLKKDLGNSHTRLYEKIRWYLDYQKIYLDRTLLSDASCILLDEPGSNLDEKTERALVDYLMKLREQKLILVISHNAYYDAVADKTYEICKHQMNQV